MTPVSKCREYCDNRWFPFTMLKAWGACVCTQEIPQAEAAIDKSKCEAKDANAVPVYYNHRYANVKACRIVNVPMETSAFKWAYNEVRAVCCVLCAVCWVLFAACCVALCCVRVVLSLCGGWLGCCALGLARF